MYTDGTFAANSRSRDPQTGHLKKGEYGSWVRGTALDIFGWTEERRTERRLISEYEAVTERLLASINERNHHTAVHLAEVPEVIRGFGHVKVLQLFHLSRSAGHVPGRPIRQTGAARERNWNRAA